MPSRPRCQNCKSLTPHRVYVHANGKRGQLRLLCDECLPALKEKAARRGHAVEVKPLHPAKGGTAERVADRAWDEAVAQIAKGAD